MIDWVSKVHFPTNLCAVLGVDFVWRIAGGSDEDGEAFAESLTALSRSLNLRYGLGSPDMSAGPQSGAPGSQATIAVAKELGGRIEHPDLPPEPPDPPGIVY